MTMIKSVEGSSNESPRMTELCQEQGEQMNMLQMLLEEWDEKHDGDVHGPNVKR